MPARKPEQEKEVLDWIGDVLGEPVPAGDFEEVSAANNMKGVTFNSRTFQLTYNKYFYSRKGWN